MKKLFCIIVLLFPSLVFAAAGVGISTWTAQTEDIISEDLVAATDISDTTGSDNGTSKKMSFAQIRQFITNKLNKTSTGSISLPEMLSNKFVSNQGSAAEVILTLPAPSYSVNLTFIVEEVQNLGIKPPSGEQLDLDGIILTANYVVDSDSTVGSKIVLTRMQNASATWLWSLDTVRGAWTDSGAI